MLSSLWNIYHSTTAYYFDPPCTCIAVLLWQRCDTLCISGLWMTSYLHVMDYMEVRRYRCRERSYCVVVRRLTPLLRSIGCLVCWTTGGAQTRRVHCARGFGGGACGAPLRCFNACKLVQKIIESQTVFTLFCVISIYFRTTTKRTLCPTNRTFVRLAVERT